MSDRRWRDVCIKAIVSVEGLRVCRNAFLDIHGDFERLNIIFPKKSSKKETKILQDIITLL